LGLGTIWGTNKLLNIEKARGLLTSLSSTAKIFSFILGIFSVLLVIIGYTSDGLYFYNTFLGGVLLFISNRLYQSSKCWKEGNWEDAKLNSKLIMFSISIFIAIMFLIYYGKDLLDF
jgi:heme O synthase-like polyprenyltransferase